MEVGHKLPNPQNSLNLPTKKIVAQLSNTVEEDNAHLSSKFRHMKYEISARHPVQGSSKKSKQENPDPSTLGTSSSYYNPRSDEGKTIVDTPQVDISDSCVKEQMKTRHRPTLKRWMQ